MTGEFRSLSRRVLLRAAAAAGLGGGAAVVLAARGEAAPKVVEKVVTVREEVEKVVEKQVPVEKVVTVEKTVTKEVEKVVTVVQQAPQVKAKVVRYATDWNSGPRRDTIDAAKVEFEKQNPSIVINMEHASRLNELIMARILPALTLSAAAREPHPASRPAVVQHPGGDPLRPDHGRFHGLGAAHGHPVLLHPEAVHPGHRVDGDQVLGRAGA
ncbi:MAG: hypothetical protein FJ029_05290 [Actinobacteria bacterium]|nr:hypothetical protein [Actinomycetota bacterium]